MPRVVSASVLFTEVGMSKLLMGKVETKLVRKKVLSPHEETHSSSVWIDLPNLLVGSRHDNREVCHGNPMPQPLEPEHHEP